MADFLRVQMFALMSALLAMAKDTAIAEWYRWVRDECGATRTASVPKAESGSFWRLRTCGGLHRRCFPSETKNSLINQMGRKPKAKPLVSNREGGSSKTLTTRFRLVLHIARSQSLPVLANMPST